MNPLRRLDVRLFASYAVVVLVGAATLAVTFALLAPTVFDNHMHDMMGVGPASSPRRAFSDALRTALPIAALTSVAVSAVVAAFVARRILRPIDDVRQTTKRLAEGHYDERVAAPGELELAALAADVNRLADALETTERRRRELISEVAHEMRTPLTTIEGYVEGMLDHVFEPTEEVLTAIGEETARMARLAADLSALSRAEEGALELQRKRTDLGTLVRSVAGRLRPQFDDKHVALGVEIADRLFVDADPQRIAQVVTNLLGNALTYTPGAGRVDVTALRDQDTIVVRISDTGIGLTPDDALRVFDRFFRVQGVPRPPGGSGIGLTISRGIARAHGGDISAHSAGPGRGSTFELRLPVALSSGAAPVSAERAGTSGSTPEAPTRFTR
jgi:histidine kinase